jgi:hypothetical protein
MADFSWDNLYVFMSPSPGNTQIKFLFQKEQASSKKKSAINFQAALFDCI